MTAEGIGAGNAGYVTFKAETPKGHDHHNYVQP